MPATCRCLGCSTTFNAKLLEDGQEANTTTVEGNCPCCNSEDFEVIEITDDSDYD